MTAKKTPSRDDSNEQKLRLVRGLIGEHATSGEIKTAFAAQFKTTPRAAERFITLVYEELRQSTGKPVEAHRADAYAFWTARASGKLADGTKVPEALRMRAQENLDRILGVHAPVKVSPTNTAGQDLPPTPERKLSKKELEAELDRLEAEMQPRTDEGAK